MNCDAITAVEGLVDRMADIAAAGKYELLDQDHLNALFKGRVVFLEPKWNCSRGDIRSDLRILAPVQPGISRQQILDSNRRAFLWTEKAMAASRVIWSHEIGSLPSQEISEVCNETHAGNTMSYLATHRLTAMLL